MKPFTLTNKKSPPRPCRQITGCITPCRQITGRITDREFPKYKHIREVEQLVQDAKNNLYGMVSDELHTKMHNLYLYI